MILESSAFKKSGTIPQKYTGFGEDVSPPLTIKDAPDETVSFAVMMDDLDVPFCKSFNHWLIWNIPKINEIPEGLPNGPKMEMPFRAYQGRAWGKNGYRGPKPLLFTKKTHRYLFTVYALDCRLAISEESQKKELLASIKGHILAKTELIGTYSRG